MAAEVKLLVIWPNRGDLRRQGYRCELHRRFQVSKALAAEGAELLKSHSCFTSKKSP